MDTNRHSKKLTDKD